MTKPTRARQAGSSMSSGFAHGRRLLPGARPSLSLGREFG
jgi:hypothetical protein